MSINGVHNSNNIASMLTSFNNTNGTSGSGNNGGMSILDYGMVNSKGYKNALKAYYKQQNTAANSEASKAAKTSLTSMKDAATDLKESAAALMNKELYAAGEDEKLDTAAIAKAVNQFVKDYNAVVKEAGNSNDNSILRNGVWMTQMMNKNSNLLSKLGITIEKDNTLSVNEDKLKTANAGTLTTVFTGQGSLANRVSQKATSFEHAATRALNNGTYNSKGNYSEEISDLISSKLDKDV